MKKLFIPIFIVSILLTGCTKVNDTPSTQNLPVSSETAITTQKDPDPVPGPAPEVEQSTTTEVATPIPEAESATESSETIQHNVIKPLKMNLDVDNIEDAILNAAYSLTDIDIEKKEITLTLYEQDIYDAIELHTMQVGDSIIVADEVYPVDKITSENEFIDINDGYTESEFGMTFMPNDGGTYRTLLLDDYATYSYITTKTFSLSDEFTLTDYTYGDYGNEGTKTDLNNWDEFTKTLEDWDTEFYYTNTTVRIVNNEVVEINRHWVP